MGDIPIDTSELTGSFRDDVERAFDHLDESPRFASMVSQVMRGEAMVRTKQILFVCTLSMALIVLANASRSQIIELESNFTGSRFDIALRKSSYNFNAKSIQNKIKPFFSDVCKTKNLSELKQNGFTCDKFRCEIKRYQFSQGIFGGHIAYQEWDISVELNARQCPKLNVSIAYRIVR